MVEVDPTISIITLAAAIGIPFILFSLKGFRNTAEGTLTGTIRLEGLKTNVVETKEEMQKGFERIESILNKRDEKIDRMFIDVNRRIEELFQKVVLNEYRIKSLERTRINNVEKDRYQQHDNEEENSGG